jgi:hypothetical protein
LTTLKRKLRVYLDSADYSNLSNPRSPPHMHNMRQTLQTLSDEGHVEFWYSGAHLSEMAPLEWEHSSLAEDRAACLSDLCGRHALISIDKLLAHEYSCLAQEHHTIDPILSYVGDWFPELGDIMPSTPWAEAAHQATDVMKGHGLNRQARRKINTHLFTKGKPKKAMLAAASSNPPDVRAILEKYPMKEQDAVIFSKYLTGDATKAEAQAAFLESLRDPRWIMQWFAIHHQEMTPVLAWARGHAPEMIARIREAAQTVMRIKTKHAAAVSVGRVHGEVLPSDPVNDIWWKDSQNELICNLVTRVAANYADYQFPLPVTPQATDAYLPGFSTSIRLLHSLTRHSVGKTARNLKESDWVDCIHAMYAPYVDVFRADKFMAPLIRQHVQKRGVTVVENLEVLLTTVTQRLSR